MKKTAMKGFCLMLAVVMLLGMGVMPAFAKSIDEYTVIAKLSDDELIQSSETQTVVLTLGLDETAQLSTFTVDVTVPDGWMVKSITNPVVEFDYKNDVNLSTGHTYYGEIEEPYYVELDTLAIYTIEIPANAVGSFELKAKTEIADPDYTGAKPTASTTLVIKEAVPQHEHTLVAYPEQPATCIATGTKAYWKCEGEGSCGKLFSDAEGLNEIEEPVTIPVNDDAHDWDDGEVTKEPTCKEKGENTFTCKLNPAHTKTEDIPTVDHKYVNGVCEWCQAEEPAFELYLEVSPQADANNNQIPDVEPGERFTAKLMLRSTTDANVDAADVTIKIPDGLTYVGTGEIRFRSNYALGASVKAGEPYQLGEGFTFVVDDDATGVLTLSIEGGAIIALRNESDEIEPDRKAAQVEVYAVYDITWDAGKGTFENGEHTRTDKVALGETPETPKNPTREGYDFGGWTPTPGTATEDITYEAIWNVKTYTVTYHVDGEEDKQQSYEYGAEIGGYAPAKDGYEFKGWYSDAEHTTETTVPDTMPAENLEYYGYFEAIKYTVTFVDENGTTVEEVEYSFGDKSVEEPEVPAKNGYEGKWNDYDLSIPGNKTVTPNYTAIEYTITFDTDGGDAIPEMKYTIGSTDILPMAKKANSTFVSWTVMVTGGSWLRGTNYPDGELLTGKYGNVTLKANYNIAAKLVTEAYQYAKSGDVLLILSMDGSALTDGQCYTYNGAPLYKTSDENYVNAVEGGADYGYVYVYIVSGELSDDQIAARLGIGTGTNEEIARDGDVNGNSKINVQDTSIVYNMLVYDGDEYTKLTVLDRLEADMITSTTNATNRGSMADVMAIAAKIQ